MTSYLDLDDYVETAAEILGLAPETVAKLARLDLAESALHAPQASWGGADFYPDFSAKAAVLLVRLTKNHALPDGNKRTALTCMVRFCLRNGYEYVPPAADDPDGEETYQRMLAIAAAPAEDLEQTEADTAGWVAERLGG
ncbi:MAG TPA: type II toxin-antitoxin system death-on-curing family toxin [Actinomycetes bacterium]|nr:type II toxin-antitoxin system death-on-curing family toxin [Actinomycetes bacterium]